MAWGASPRIIYLPSDLPQSAYVPGGTLTDVIRHEYAHAWHWLEPDFFDSAWFRRAFGAEYEDGDITPLELWTEGNERSRNFKQCFGACRNDRERAAFLRKRLFNDFVSDYATTHFCEDFAETFMYYLRYRRSLDRFKSRSGVFRKLTAVASAVSRARRELGL